MTAEDLVLCAASCPRETGDHCGISVRESLDLISVDIEVADDSSEEETE
jgi:hypothetical protein